MEEYILATKTGKGISVHNKSNYETFIEILSDLAYDASEAYDITPQRVATDLLLQTIIDRGKHE